MEARVDRISGFNRILYRLIGTIPVNQNESCRS